MSEEVTIQNQINMVPSIPKEFQGKPPYTKSEAYEKFIEWMALPMDLRQVQTQVELAQIINVDAATLSDWKHRPDFWTRVEKCRHEWTREKTPTVIKALYRKILKRGDAPEVKLWMQLIEGWIEKQENENKQKIYVIARGGESGLLPGTDPGLAQEDSVGVEPLTLQDPVLRPEGTEDNL